jgi:hypothetical protein
MQSGNGGAVVELDTDRGERWRAAVRTPARLAATAASVHVSEEGSERQNGWRGRRGAEQAG